MWFKRKSDASELPVHRGPFEGVGVYLTSEVHSVKSRGIFNPAALVHAQSEILDYQHRIIEEADGLIDQFVGDCVLAYWPPSDLDRVLHRANDAIHRIIREKVAVADLEYHLAIRFCASELAGAFFGSATVFRFQVIDRARSRAEALPRSIPGLDCAFTDRDTYEAMPQEIRRTYEPLGEIVYALRPSP